MKTLEFRDGSFPVTDAVAQHLEALETYQLTYKEAMRKMNDRFLTERINKAHKTAVDEHLARYRQ